MPAGLTSSTPSVSARHPIYLSVLPDPAILLGAEKSHRILVTLDVGTMEKHVRAHLAAGRHCPGVFLVSVGAEISYLIEMLAAAAYASDAEEWYDRTHFIA
jgi:hypothetical protein